MSTYEIEEMGLTELDELVARHIMSSPTNVWAFSTKIERAILVVDRVIGAGFYFHLSHSDETGEWEWEARIEQRKTRKRNEARQMWVAFDKSLPRAICEAALRWSGKCEDPEDAE